MLADESLTATMSWRPLPSFKCAFIGSRLSCDSGALGALATTAAPEADGAISRCRTFREWVMRYQEQGLTGLRSLSSSTTYQTQAQCRFRGLRDGVAPHARPRRAPSGRCSVTTTIPRFASHGSPDVHHRCSRSLPGQRVQVGTCKIGTGLIQFPTADDCTRLLHPAPVVLGLYLKRNAAHGTHFLVERVLEGSALPRAAHPPGIIGNSPVAVVSSWFPQLPLRDHHVCFLPVRPPFLRHAEVGVADGSTLLTGPWLSQRPAS